MLRSRVLAMMGLLSLLGVACGSRLNQAQIAALNAPAGQAGAAVASGDAGSRAGAASTALAGTTPGASNGAPSGGGSGGAAAAGALSLIHISEPTRPY